MGLFEVWWYEFLLFGEGDFLWLGPARCGFLVSGALQPFREVLTVT